LIKLLGVFDQEALNQEWGVDPRPIKVLDKHADSKLFDRDFLLHGNERSARDQTQGWILSSVCDGNAALFNY
jgi:hypothetical protein